MPFYDPYDHEERRSSRHMDELSQAAQNASKLADKNKRLEAMLCAIITELEKAGYANTIISQASKSGKIDIMSFWQEHSKHDETRLAKALHKFSEHEQAVLKKLLNKNKS